MLQNCSTLVLSVTCITLRGVAVGLPAPCTSYYDRGRTSCGRSDVTQCSPIHKSTSSIGKLCTHAVYDDCG